MGRRPRSRLPGAAKLASGVVAGGVSLGLLISLAVDPRMKSAEFSPRPARASVEPFPAQPSGLWPDDRPGRAERPGIYRPDLAPEAAAAARLALEAEGEFPPPVEEAIEAADAADAAVETASEAAVSTPATADPAPSEPAQGGLY